MTNSPTLRQVSPGAVAERLNGDANTVVRLGALLHAAATSKTAAAQSLAAAPAGGGSGGSGLGGGGGSSVGRGDIAERLTAEGAVTAQRHAEREAAVRRTSKP